MPCGWFEVPISLQTPDDRCCIVTRVFNTWWEFQVLATCGLLPVGVKAKSKLHVENLQVFSIFMWLWRPLISRISRPNLSYYCNHLLYMKILKQWIWIPMLVAADRVTMSDQTSLLQMDRLYRFVQLWTPGTCWTVWNDVMFSGQLPPFFCPMQKIRASLSQSRPTTAGCQPWSCPPFSPRIFQDFSAVALDLCNFCFFLNMEN